MGAQHKSPLPITTLLVLGAVLVLATVLFRQSQKGAAGGNDSPAVGKPYLPQEFPPLTAEKPVTQADLHGKVVLVNFWGWWCGPCQVEFPHLAELEKSLHETADFRFVSVASSGNRASDESDPELKDRTQAFLTERHSDLPTYKDPLAKEQLRLAEITGQPPVYPVTVIIDRAGIIRGVWRGYRDGDELSMRAIIDEALKAAAKGDQR